MKAAAVFKSRGPAAAGVPAGLECVPNSRVVALGQDADAAPPLEEYHSLLKQRLDKPLLTLFRQLTGLRLHLWWHKPGPELPPSALRKRCPHARQRRSARLLRFCEECLRKRSPQEWSDLLAEKRFDCQCGLTNFYVSLKVQDQPMVTLLVQQPTPASRADKQSFSRAVSLTRLIFHDLKGTLEAGRAAVYVESRHNAPAAQPGHFSDTSGVGLAEPHSHSVNGNHRQQLVQRMLDYIQRHYSHPIQLRDLAAAVNLNASYVSSLLSATLGVTFHQYLEELRLARAKVLLRDPVKRVSEVAYAVGYSNANHFRNVFSTHLGLSPSAWRRAQTS
jgi:AraC-like DNA-binding protein